MRRRDLPKALLATVAAGGATANGRRTDEQGSTARTYAQTSAESAAKVTPTNYAYPPGDAWRYGTDPTGLADSTSAIQAAINQHIQGGPAVTLRQGTYKTAASLNIGDQVTVYSGLQLLGIGLPVIKCTNSAVPIITLGGTFMQLAGLNLQYASLPANTQTNAVAIRCYNVAYSKIDRLYACNVFGVIDLYQGSVAGTGCNAFFSNNVSNIVCQRFSGWAISLLPYNGGDSGNFWQNIYIGNNVNGTPKDTTPCFGGLRLRTSNDGVFEQLNIEWCRNSMALISLTASGNVTFNGLHFEGNYPTTAFQPLIDIAESGGGIGCAPTLNGITVAGNDWTGYGGALQGALFRMDFNGKGIRAVVRGIDCHNNTNPGYMTVLRHAGPTCYGSTIEFESVVDFDGSLSHDAYTPKAEFGAVTANTEMPLLRWNQMIRKHSAMVTDNAGGTAASVCIMTGTDPNGTDDDALGLWSASGGYFIVKQTGSYVAGVTIPSGTSPVIQVRKNGTVVASIAPVSGRGACVCLSAVRNDQIGFSLASGSYTRAGVTFGISLGSAGLPAHDASKGMLGNELLGG